MARTMGYAEEDPRGGLFHSGFLTAYKNFRCIDAVPALGDGDSFRLTAALPEPLLVLSHRIPEPGHFWPCSHHSAVPGYRTCGYRAFRRKPKPDGAGKANILAAHAAAPGRFRTCGTQQGIHDRKGSLL